MDAFKVHETLIEDYRKFTEGFVDLRDERISDSAREQAARGAQWPDPWLSLNPSFETGGTVDELVAGGILHPAAGDIFRVGKDEPSTSRALTFHRHQREAIGVAATGASYALTTGTGSGKSLAYAMQKAIDTGTEYLTTLDPPPGHGPRHPASPQTTSTSRGMP